MRWAGARWWRGPWPPMPTARSPAGKRLAALADRRRTGAPVGPRGRRERAVCGAGAGRSGVAASDAGRRTGRRRGARAAGPALPQRRGPRHPGAARAPAGALAAPGWDRGAAHLLRDRRTRRAAFRRRRQRRASRRASCCSTRTGACCCSAGRTRPPSPTQRRAGGSPSAAPFSRGRSWPTPRCANWPRRPGCRVGPADLVGPVWRRDAVIDFNGSVIRSEEMFFVYRTTRFEPSTGGRTALERRYIHGHRWCDADDHR